MNPIDIIIWTCVAVFVVTATLTLLHVSGIYMLPNSEHGKVLFRALIIEIVIISVGAFGLALNENDKIADFSKQGNGIKKVTNSQSPSLNKDNTKDTLFVLKQPKVAIKSAQPEVALDKPPKPSTFSGHDRVKSLQPARLPPEPTVMPLNPKTPVNIANFESGLEVDSNLFQLDINSSINQLFDRDTDTVLRINSSLLKQVKYSLRFNQPIDITAISIFQPSTVDVGEHLKFIEMRVKANNAWGNWQLVTVKSGAGEIFLDVNFNGLVTELEVNPIENRLSYGYTTLGDIAVYIES